jgi:hypothetical protein
MSDSPQPDTLVVSRENAELWQRSAALLDRMLGDPSVAPAAEDLIKKVNPNAVFPNRVSRESLLAPANEAIERHRTETAAQIAAAEARAQALEDKIAAREAKEADLATQAETAALERRINDVRSKRGFSEEKMQEVLARMREQNNPDVDAAAAWVSESIPKPLPASGHDYLPSQVDVYGGITDAENKAWDGLRTDPQRWQTQELRNIVKDPEFLRLGNQ